MTDTAVIRQSVRPKPCAGPRRSDLVFASRRPITAVAIAFADKEGPAYRYHTASTEQTSSSRVAHADTIEPAVLDVIRQVQPSRSARKVGTPPQRATASVSWTNDDNSDRRTRRH